MVQSLTWSRAEPFDMTLLGPTPWASDPCQSVFKSAFQANTGSDRWP